MITAQVEEFMDVIEEARPLLALHWEELALDRDKVPLDPQFDVYAQRAAAGMILCVRQAGAMIGYFCGFVAPGLHYRTCLTLTMDIFFLAPAHRDGSPSAALKLFRAVEQEARRRGVQRWFVGSKVHRDASRLFEHLGFAQVETYYSKWIGE